MKYILAYSLDGLLMGNLLIMLSIFRKIVTSIQYDKETDTLKLSKLNYFGSDYIQ